MEIKPGVDDLVKRERADQQAATDQQKDQVIQQLQSMYSEACAQIGNLNVQASLMQRQIEQQTQALQAAQAEIATLKGGAA
ncbi:hypothetical protein [Pseudooceanicola sp. MF1-13]|uniref:hypothetical protein n=1 Tax=Pseudooceanicola sp. MF1-13 TaxID=3379095 RepID=UPI003891A71B